MINPAFTISIYRTLEEIETIRPFWGRFQYHLNADIDFYRSILLSQKGSTPYITLLSQNDIPQLLLIGRLENINISQRFGYLKLPGFKKKSLTIIYCGVIGECSKEICDEAVRQLLNLFNRRDFNILFFSNLKENSPIFSSVRTVPGFFCSDHCLLPNLHWRMEIPSSVDKVLEKLKRKHRYWIRRISKILEEEHDNQVELKVYTSPANLNRLFDDMESIASKTYQRSLGSGFMNNEQYRTWVSMAAHKNWLRGYILYIKGNPVAYWLTTIYKRSVFSDSTGYIPSVEKYEAGTYLFIKMLDDLCREMIADKFDFGFGDALYKQRFGDEKWNETSLFIYPTTISGIASNLLRTTLVYIFKIVRNIIDKLKVDKLIKNKWRKKLINTDKIEEN